MKKNWFKIILTLKNAPKTIILINIYFFAIIYISRNKHIKFIVTCDFFLNNIELCNTNHAFKFALPKSINLFSPAKHYGEWMIQMYEIIHDEIITIHKKLKQPKFFLETCKKCSKNQKIVLQNKFMLIIEEMLQITKKTKLINAAKSA